MNEPVTKGTDEGAGDTPPSLQDIYQEAVDLEERSIKLGKLHNLQQVRRNRGQRDRAVQTRIWVAVVVLAVVGFFAKNIITGPHRYPILKAWWDRVTSDKRLYAKKGSNFYALRRNETGQVISPYDSPSVQRGTAKVAQRGIGVYQIATTVDFPAVSTMMNFIMVWPHLSRRGAQFILESVHHFDTQETMGVMNLLHLQGGLRDYMSDDYAGPGGGFDPLSLVAGTPRTNVPLTASTAWSNWSTSAAHGNIWYELFPRNQADFSKINIIRGMIGSVPGSSPTAELEFKALVNGGLLEVASLETDDSDTSNSLVNKYFGATTRRVRPDCNAQKVDGAINGMLGMGSVAPGLVSMAGPAGLAAITAMSIGGGVMGYFAGGAAAKEACQA